ncbi:MAG: MFS transporter [Candidatus Humimicrobiaceae bacterium]
MNLVGPLIPLIAADLKVGLDYIGLTISIGSFALLFTALTTGFLIDVYGFKRVMFAGGLLIIAASFGLFFSYSYILFTIFYCLLQLGIGTLAISTMSIVGNHYFEDKSKNILQVNIGLTIGAIIAPLIVSMVAALETRWQVLFVYMILLQIILIVFLVFLRIPKDKTPRINLEAYKNIVLRPLIILCGLMTLLYISTIKTFYTWLTSYFTILDIRLSIGALILAFFAIATLAGMFLKNYLVRFFNEKKLLIISIFFSFVLLILVLVVSDLLAKVILIFLFGINIAGNFSLTFSIGMDVGSEHSNAVSSFLHACGYIGVIVFQYLSGYFSENFSKNSVLYIDIALLFALLITAIIVYRKEADYSGKTKL